MVPLILGNPHLGFRVWGIRESGLGLSAHDSGLGLGIKNVFMEI